MAWYLQPLHEPSEPAIVLPRTGTVTVGRRPGNTILCKDLAVSGQHCIIHCCGGSADPPEVEDSSTNGSYVNEIKITKGQRHRLIVDDILSLTKPPDEPGALDTPIRVQFRAEFREAPPPLAAEAAAVARPLTRVPGAERDVPATAPDPKPQLEAGGALGAGAGDGWGAEGCFAQDLLVQEQQSKAKITAQLLQSQGKLEEERQAAEAASRELEKVRKQVAEERARRHEAEESRDRLATEAETLRAERRQLQELRVSHEELRQRHEVVQLELQTRQQKCTQLEATQEQLRRDLEKAVENHQKASQQHAELQTRVRQAQERSDRLEQQYAEAKREADWAQEEGGRLESELAAERKTREELEEQVSTTREQVAKAETSERTAREALDTATARRAELECQASSAHSDLEGARAAARQAQQRLTASKQLLERLHDAGKGLSAELKRRAEVWEKALVDSNFDGLEEAMASGGPTFAQITCQVETPPTKSQHEGGDTGKAPDAVENEPENRVAADVAAPAELELGGGPPAEIEQRPDAIFPPAPSTSVLAPAATEPPVPAGEPREPSGGGPQQVAIDDDEDDELLAAAAREPPGEAGSAHIAAAAIVENSAGGGPAGALPPGVSTAWSLEMLDVAAGMDLSHPAKKLRRSGE